MATSKSIPATLNFIHKKGDTFQRQLVFETDEDSPQPIDLSGATIKMIIEGGITDLTLGNGLTVQGDDDNELLIQTDDFDWTGKKKYELEVTYATGVVTTHFAGYINLKDELEEDA